MSKADKVVEFFSEFSDGVASLFSTQGNSYIDLETAQGNGHTLVRPDGTLVSLIWIRGTQRVVGVPERKHLNEQILEGLDNALSRSGHGIEIVFRRDYDTIVGDIDRALTPARKTGRRLGMDVDWIMDAKRDKLAEWCASEGGWMAVSTDYRIFSAIEAKMAGKEYGDNTQKNPQGRSAMNMADPSSAMLASHEAMVNSMCEMLDNAAIFNRPLNPHEALQVMRREFDPEATSDEWRPLLPGDRISPRSPVTENKHDPSSVLYPRLKSQLVPREPGKIVRNRWIEIGDRTHSPIAMRLMPQERLPFQRILSRLINSHTPFRMSFSFHPDGAGQIHWAKNAIGSLLSFTSTANKQFKMALRELKERELSGETLVGIRVIADTWADQGDEDTLRRRTEQLQKAMQSWGQADTQDVSGDPLAGVCATIPGLTRDNPAPVTAGPLWEMVPMLPMTRPSSPWEAGALLFRSPDGRVLPYQPGSKMQAAWVTLGFAPMGRGKSVLLNAHNLSLALLQGLERLPFISILDIGPSSTGIISLLKHSLPKDQQHLVLHRRLQMRTEDSINPFQTPMGLRRPLPDHRAMLINFLTTLATKEGDAAAQDGISGIAATVVDRVFDNIQDDANPKRFDPRFDPDIAQAIEDHGIQVDGSSSWWEIEDELFKHGRLELAERAHAMAMPLLGDCAQAAHDQAITSVYKGVATTQESMPDYFWRSMNESISRYPILSQPTKFSIGAARVVALDLQDVCPKGGAEADKQTGIMYSLARYVLAQRYFMDEESVPAFPKLYRDYYKKLTKDLKAEPKLLCMDEFHRTQGVEGVRAQIIRDIREGRKFGVQIALFSQDPSDFDDTMVNLSSTRFVLGADTPGVAEEVSKKFGLSASAANIIHGLRKPGREGAGMYISTRTERGDGEMFAFLTLGPVELWAYESNNQNRAVRDGLYERVGVKLALTALAERFPAGSAVDEIERRREQSSEDDDEAVTKGVIDGLIDEIHEKILMDTR